MKRTTWHQRHPTASLILVCAAAFVALALIAEKALTLRMEKPGLSTRRYIRLSERRPLASRIFCRPNADFLRYTDTLAPGDYVLEVDPQGFIAPSKVHEDPDVTILFLGGSTTESVFVSERERFPYLAGRLLEKATGRAVNAYNAGMSGNNSLHSIDILLNKGIPLKPDIAVMMHNVNDLAILLNEGTYWNDNPTRSPIVEVRPSFTNIARQLKDMTIPHLYIAAVEAYRYFFAIPLEDDFRHMRGKKIRVDRQPLLDEFRMNLRTFINICRARNVMPVLMTQANRLKEDLDPIVRKWFVRYEERGGSISYGVFKEMYDAFNQAIRDVGRENGVVVIDLASEIPQEKEYLYDPFHFNDKGSRRAAEIVCERLKSTVSAFAGATGRT